MEYSMPRSARGLIGDSYYHVINRGNASQQIFHDEGDYEELLSLFEDALKKYSVRLFAYCIMPNHFHLLVKPDTAEDLSRLMQWLMTSHVRRYHQSYRTRGHLWQGRFK